MHVTPHGDRFKQLTVSCIETSVEVNRFMRSKIWKRNGRDSRDESVSNKLKTK
jgi:hypothetical protein